GAEEAWITDEVGPEQVGALFLRAGQIGRVTRLVGIGLSVLLASIHLALPYAVSGALLLVLALFLYLTMPETAWQRQERPAGESHLRAMKETFVEGIRTVRGSPVLMLLLGTALIGGAGSEGVDRLWEAHLLTTHQLGRLLTVTPALGFGLLAVASTLLGLIVGRAGERWLDLNQPRTTTLTLVLSMGVRVVMLVGFALAPSLWLAVLCYLLYDAAGALFFPAQNGWTNQQIPSRIRATVLSLVSQSNALGQTVGGPGVGWVGTRFSLKAALVAAAALLAPTLGLYASAVKRAEPDAVEPAVGAE
ncbi:MAG TPA: MFS transporter, partial [Symbiobacteriaceae bacterium]|nr:MFS transporter [Symbiobacteriaceae bacterium]